jgi:hypothetical protein
MILLTILVKLEMVKGENKTDFNIGHDFIQNKQKGSYHVTLLVDEMLKH